ncbi:DUF6796 family protein [Treponema phagedenis]|uniref:DUF6796 family protein n=1 Tax=Treponema phagedenis TaxID=162 RepID=UPI001583E9F9|nr:DUF6796 family protein [Treponema phagedenis]NVP22895.1 hypothetical protein [Treponema phagedenis]QKS92247.1 hypothetical protein HPJ96_06525 [Treponema phagedenis]QLC57793.1 hypothetical protein HW453_02360 [Treponema phagedenis]
MYLNLTLAMGLFGGILMFCGDMLLCFTTEEFDFKDQKKAINIIKKFPQWRLRLGGLLGPVSAFFICIGFFNNWFGALDEYKTFGFAISLISCLATILGGAWHSHFTYLGLVGKTENEEAIDQMVKNIKFWSKISVSIMIIDVILIAAMIVLRKTVYPRWFILFTPLVTQLSYFLFNKLPKPFKVIFTVGLGNLMLIVYFGVALLIV